MADYCGKARKQNDFRCAYLYEGCCEYTEPCRHRISKHSVAIRFFMWTVAFFLLSLNIALMYIDIEVYDNVVCVEYKGVK